MGKIKEEDFEIENKEEPKKVPVYYPKKEEPKREEYIEKMNKVYEPNNMKLLEKSYFDDFNNSYKKKTMINGILGILALLAIFLLVANLFWFNISLKDGKFQSTTTNPVDIDTPVYVNASCSPITYNNITNVNNIYNSVSACNYSVIYQNQTQFSNIVLINVTIINSTIYNSSIINSTINSTI